MHTSDLVQEGKKRTQSVCNGADFVSYLCEVVNICMKTISH